jgi:quercetin dioxygenase-like cupin family protein
MSGVIGTGLLAWAAAVGPAELLAQAQSTFMGGNPSQMPADKLRTLRLKFPKGSRSNWHSHTWGQLLMVEEGHGLTQDRNGPVKVMSPGQPWFTKAGVEHWHGAAVDEDMVQLTIYEGEVKWLEPVTDAQYRATPQR